MSSKVKLVELTSKIGSGSTPTGGKSAYLDSGLYKLIRSQNIYNHFFSEGGLAYITEEQATKLKGVTLEKDDILINITGDSVARVAMVTEQMLPGRVNQHVSIIRCNQEKINPYYLLAILTSDEMQRHLLSLAQVGGTRAALTKSMLENLEIQLLKKYDQEFIANLLKSINSKIENNKAIITNLELICSTLFKRWFIDFEFPNEQGLPYRSSGSEMAESELGEIPKGWEVKKLNYLAEIIMGQSPKGTSYNFEFEGLPLVNGASDFKGGEITPAKYTTEPKKISQKGDYIFGVRATLGNVTETHGEYAIGRGAGIARCRERYLKEFLYFQLVDAFISFEHTASGSVYLNISKNDLNDYKIVLPTNTMLQKFHETTSAMLEKKEDLIQENIHLKNVRDTLLPKLLSGEIEIPDESVVEPS